MSSAPIFDELSQVYVRAAARKDVEMMVSIYADGVHVFDTFEAWMFSGRDALRRATESWFTSAGEDQIKVQFHDMHVSGEAELRALHATVSFAAVNESGAVLRSMQNRLTWIAQLIGDEWKIVHQHTSVPISDDTLTGILKGR